MKHLVTVSACSLNQWSLDFVGNTQRIIDSIRQAKEAGSSLRVGSELEICGYGCGDHLLEGDTELHCWECLAEIISHEDTQDIMLDIGMPVRHRNTSYNCRVICLNKRILLIRPKTILAGDGNYREHRWFSAWKPRKVQEHQLPQIITEVTSQKVVDIGDALITTEDTCFGAETCEELFSPLAPHPGMGLDGCEIFTNSSGSHWELRKLQTRVDLIKNATLKNGGLYLYANQKGCDGDRLYFDGSSMIILNGRILAMGDQFSLEDVEVVTATVDLEEIRSYRSARSRGDQAGDVPAFKRITADFCMSGGSKSTTKEMAVHFLTTNEEIAYGPACYLWDYLRRSRQAGFFLPLSGGIDSCATACIVSSMCRLVMKAVQRGNLRVLEDVRRIAGEAPESTWTPKTHEEIAGRIFHTAYMGMEKNSSPETRKRSRDLAKAIGSSHLDFDIDKIVDAIIFLFSTVTSFTPVYKMYGGKPAENLALQNVQARTRMVLAYLFAQLLPTVRGRTASGSLLVLGSANVDEALRGYYTKYDCSAADINPIGGISKTDLKAFIKWASQDFANMQDLLLEFIDAPPTAELEPIISGEKAYVQSDEVDMGMTYAELSIFGRLRKVEKLGVWKMWEKLVDEWGDVLSPQEIYTKVRHFHYTYSINRHKMTTLTPSVHAEQYSPEDNRFDLRPFLYPIFEWPYAKIERAIAGMGTEGQKVRKRE